MATASKAGPKVVQIDDGAKAPPPKKSPVKLLVVAAVLLMGAGGAGAWFFMGAKAEKEAAAKAETPKPPLYLPIDQFTVNLQQEMGEHYLQTAFTLQVSDQSQADLIKLYMPLVRSRLLMLLSSKKPSELSTAEGKEKLQEEIVARLQEPFAPNGAPVGVTGVFFTSFVIQ
ncbi:MAG TPA: flagellar basal body-associated protein FliL [Noviherbaspirillum sp.]|nr:flagellar basal body-associated protein FliL [Noviherbaspirillum sp.]